MNRDDRDVPLSRRTCLKLLGATAATATLAGCSENPDVTKTTRRPTSTSDGPPPTATPPGTTAADPTDLDQYELSFDRVVNMKEKGADANANEPIDDLLTEHAADRTLLYFPPGRYRMAEGLKLSSFTNFGVVGKDATIVAPPGNNKYLFVFGSDPPGDSRGLLFQNITFDVRGRNKGPFVLNVLVDDEVYVRDITVRGKQSADQPVLGMAITDEGGSGIVERASFPDGGTSGTTPVGIFVHKLHVGEVTFRDCRVEWFPNNGIYASRAKGPVKVEGGLYRNNDISQVRLGSKGSYAKDVDVVIDGFRPKDRNQRGIWLRNPAGVLVENCRVKLEESVGSSAVEVYSGGGATFRNCRVEVNASKYAFRFERGDPDVKGNVLLEDVSITGSASGEMFPYAMECLRDSTVFRNVTLNQTGSNRHGLWIRAKDCVVDGGSWIASRRPIAISLTEIEEGTCLAHIRGVEVLRATAVKDPGNVLRFAAHDGVGLGGADRAGYCVGGNFVSEALRRAGQFMVVINGQNTNGAIGRIVPQ